MLLFYSFFIASRINNFVNENHTRTRMNGDDTIYKRSEEEILIAQDRRAVEMICERLIELNVIKREEYFKYLTIMTTNPEK